MRLAAKRGFDVYSRTLWSLPLCSDPWGDDSREVAPASVYMGEMTRALDVTLIMHAVVDVGFVEEVEARKQFKKSYRPVNLS